MPSPYPDVEALRRLCSEGLTIIALTKTLGCSEKMVRKIAKLHGIAIPDSRNLAGRQDWSGPSDAECRAWNAKARQAPAAPALTESCIAYFSTYW